MTSGASLNSSSVFRFSFDVSDFKLALKSFEESESSSSTVEIPELRGSTSDTTLTVNDALLPPVDHGFHAWAYLASAWLVELIVWSIPNSYGVFLNYYYTTLFDRDDPQVYLLPIVGTLQSGIVYLASFLILFLMVRFPAYKQIIPLVGICLCIGSFIGAAYSTTPMHLLLTQGVLYGLGGTSLYFPILTYLPEWFVQRRGLANGILFSGMGLGGIFIPFVAEALLHHCSQRNAFISLGAIYGAMAFPACFYARPRLPPTRAITTIKSDTSFVRSQIFWVFCISNLLQASVHFLPGIWVPSFATALGLNPTLGTLAVVLMNATSVPGMVIIGGLSDRYAVWCAISLSTMGAAIGILLVWGFASALAPLLVFTCIYGFFSGAYSVIWTKSITIIVGDDAYLHNALMALFVTTRGIGNVLSGPLSNLLRRHSFAPGKTRFGYGVEGYGSLILFSGLCMLASTIGAAYPFFLGKTISIPLPANCFKFLARKRANRTQNSNTDPKHLFSEK